eukprot:m.32095 g.32095  ORF g.32095 m.32095 type:complete len:549 (+) comp8378_c0_seq2:286-1932(+)
MLLVGAIVVLALSGHDATTTRVVTITNGPITGNALPRADEFLGIPFGTSKRFEAGTLYSGTFPHNPQPMQQFGPACMQILTENTTYGVEECFVMNVWTPKNATSESRLPVLGFVYGGNYDFDEAEPYNASELVANQNIVVFSFNYRVGPLGYLAFEEDVHNKAPTGNWGQFDMILALKWAKRELHNFGGDPEKIALFGQSSGGSAVATLSLMPPANGLFTGSISQSGPPYVRTLEDALKATEYVGKRVGCVPPTRECLQKISADKIVLHQDKLNGGPAPCVDGVSLPDQPDKLIAEGKMNDNLHLLWGSNTNDSMRDLSEAWCEVSAEGALGKCERMGKAYYITGLVGAVGKNYSEEALAMYPPDPAGEDNLFRTGWWQSHRFQCSFRQLVKQAVASGGAKSAYVYRFDYWMKDNSSCVTQYNYHPERFGTMHADEVSFVMGQPTFMYVGYTNCSVPGWSGYDPGCVGCKYSVEEAIFAKQVGRFWSNMAATGDPNLRNENAQPLYDESWPKFTPETQMGLILHPTESGEFFKSEGRPSYCDFWDKIA